MKTFALLGILAVSTSIGTDGSFERNGGWRRVRRFNCQPNQKLKQLVERSEDIISTTLSEQSHTEVVWVGEDEEDMRKTTRIVVTRPQMTTTTAVNRCRITHGSMSTIRLYGKQGD